MKNQFLCLLLVSFGAISYGMVFNCVDTTSPAQCPPEVKNCQKVTKCGVCNICEDTLGEGETCMLSIFMLTLTHKQCGPGLVCDQETIKCQKLSNTKLIAVEGNKLVTRPPSFVSCKDSMCFCVHEGKQLEDYVLLKEEHLTPHSCKCAHEKAQYQRKKLIGLMFNCNEKGSYKRRQCKGSSCYCVNEDGEQIPNTSLHVSQIGDLTC